METVHVERTLTILQWISCGLWCGSRVIRIRERSRIYWGCSDVVFHWGWNTQDNYLLMLSLRNRKGHSSYSCSSARIVPFFNHFILIDFRNTILQGVPRHSDHDNFLLYEAMYNFCSLRDRYNQNNCNYFWNWVDNLLLHFHFVHREVVFLAQREILF